LSKKLIHQTVPEACLILCYPLIVGLVAATMPLQWRLEDVLVLRSRESRAALGGMLKGSIVFVVGVLGPRLFGNNVIRNWLGDVRVWSLDGRYSDKLPMHDDTRQLRVSYRRSFSQ